MVQTVQIIIEYLRYSVYKLSRQNYWVQCNKNVLTSLRVDFNPAICWRRSSKSSDDVSGYNVVISKHILEHKTLQKHVRNIQHLLTDNKHINKTREITNMLMTIIIAIICLVSVLKAKCSNACSWILQWVWIIGLHIIDNLHSAVVLECLSVCHVTTLQNSWPIAHFQCEGTSESLRSQIKVIGSRSLQQKAKKLEWSAVGWKAIL